MQPPKTEPEVTVTVGGQSAAFPLKVVQKIAGEAIMALEKNRAKWVQQSGGNALAVVEKLDRKLKNARAFMAHLKSVKEDVAPIAERMRAILDTK